MTKQAMIETVGILKALFLLDHPKAEFQSDEKIFKLVHKRGLVHHLKYLMESLKIAPDRTIEEYQVPVQNNRTLAMDLSQFYLDCDMVLSSGEPVQEQLFIPFANPKNEDDVAIIPAIVSQGTTYSLVTEDEIPGALRFLRGGFIVTPSVFHEVMNEMR
ncbi:MAG: hypothetical protein ACSLFH_08130 [Desulfuromonadales bacterium]